MKETTSKCWLASVVLLLTVAWPYLVLILCKARQSASRNRKHAALLKGIEGWMKMGWKERKKERKKEVRK